MHEISDDCCSFAELRKSESWLQAKTGGANWADCVQIVEHTKIKTFATYWKACLGCWKPGTAPTSAWGPALKSKRDSWRDSRQKIRNIKSHNLISYASVWWFSWLFSTDSEERHKQSIFVAAFTLFRQEGHVEMVMLHSAGHNVHVDDLPGINMHFTCSAGKPYTELTHSHVCTANIKDQGMIKARQTF